MTDQPFQLFKPLDSATEAALRASIERFGVLVPVARDQHGRTLDGHQRARIAADLGVTFRVDVHQVADDGEARDLAATLNADRRQLTVAQRRDVVQALREQGHSLRAIAGAIGVHHSTVEDDLSTVGNPTVEPERIVGRDGKSRPAKRKKRTVVAAKTEREAERAQAALEQLAGNAPQAVLDTKRVERLAREQQAEERAAEPLPQLDDDNICVLHGDLATVLDDEDLHGATVITDPPYPREHLHAWETLAGRALAWGAARLVLMSGQMLLPDVLDAIRTTPQWRWRWCGAYLTPGPATRVWGANVGSAWKPILVFDRDGDDRPFAVTDVFRSAGDDKQHHHWGQNEQGIAQIVETFTQPGDLVVDPFVGGGTTAVVCRDLGRRFVGCDIDQAAVDTTLRRLAA